MNNQITESNYEEYKRLYKHKRNLTCFVGLFMLLDVVVVLSFIPIDTLLSIVEIANSTAILFGLTNQILVLMVVSTIIYEYKQKTELLKKRYPFIDSKLNNRNLKKLLKEYRMSTKEKMIENKIENDKEDEKEIINDQIYNSSSFNHFPKEKLERAKVKIKTLTRNKMIYK